MRRKVIKRPRNSNKVVPEVRADAMDNFGPCTCAACTARMALRSNVSPVARVWAPFRYTGPVYNTSSHDGRESFFCHGYRQEGEHYHKTLTEMEDCPLLRPVEWTPPVRKVRS